MDFPQPRRLLVAQHDRQVFRLGHAVVELSLQPKNTRQGSTDDPHARGTIWPAGGGMGVGESPRIESTFRSRQEQHTPPHGRIDCSMVNRLGSSGRRLPLERAGTHESVPLSLARPLGRSRQESLQDGKDGHI